MKGPKRQRSSSSFANHANRVWEHRIPRTIGTLLGARLDLFWHGISFTGREKKVGFDAVLLGIEVVVAATGGVKLRMRTALDDLSRFDDKNLIAAANGGETVGDDECGSSMHQIAQAFLNQRLGFRVQAGRGLVENQDARVGQNCAGDGYALLLASGKLYAAFADQSVVLVAEIFGEFVHARDAAGGKNLLFGGVRAGEADIFADGSVEEKSLLKNDSELSAIGIQ